MRYQFRVKGHLAPHWSAWLAGLEITPTDDGMTLLHGEVRDQAELRGLLNRICDIGVELVAVLPQATDEAGSSKMS